MLHVKKSLIKMLKVKLQQNIIIYFENEDNMELVKKKKPRTSKYSVADKNPRNGIIKSASQ